VGCKANSVVTSRDANNINKKLEKKINKAREYCKQEKYEEADKIYTEILKETNNKDIRLEKEYIKKYQMTLTKRAYLWTEKGYLTEDEIKDLGIKIDKGIEDVENYLKKSNNNNISYDGYEKMHFIITSEAGISSARSGVSKIQLFWVKEKASPYVHETTHIVAGRSKYRWLTEGLAVLIDDLYNPWDNFPNFQFEGEQIAKDYIIWSEEGIEKTKILKDIYKEVNLEKQKEIHQAISKILKDIGSTSHTVAIDDNSTERNIYYCFAGSYMKYLVEKLGIEKVMKVYSSNEPEITVKEVSNKSFDAWREEWINYLKSNY